MALNVSATSKLTTATATNGLATSATVLAANPGMTSFLIQNQDTHALNLAFGVAATSSVYHVILKACSSAGDGTGGVYTDQTGMIWNGAIYCYAQGAGTASYSVYETSDN